MCPLGLIFITGMRLKVLHGCFWRTCRSGFWKIKFYPKGYGWFPRNVSVRYAGLNKFYLDSCRITIRHQPCIGGHTRDFYSPRVQSLGVRRQLKRSSIRRQSVDSGIRVLITGIIFLISNKNPTVSIIPIMSFTISINPRIRILIFPNPPILMKLKAGPKKPKLWKVSAVKRSHLWAHHNFHQHQHNFINAVDGSYGRRRAQRCRIYRSCLLVRG